MSLGEGYFDLAAKRLAPLVTFFLGAMLARLLLRLFHRPAVPLLLEAALLAVVGFLPIGREAALLLVAPGDGAAGLGDHPFRRHGGQHRGGDQHARAHRRGDARPAVADRPRPALGRHAAAAGADLDRLLAGAVGGVLLVRSMPWPLLVPAALLVIAVPVGGTRRARA